MILKVVNPVRKISEKIKSMRHSFVGKGTKRHAAYKHRPVFYSTSADRLGTRADAPVLNKRKKKRLKRRKHNSQTIHRKDNTILARRRTRTKHRRTHNKAAKRRTRRRRYSNLLSSRRHYRTYNRRHHNRRHHNRIHRRRRHNPEIMGSSGYSDLLMKSGVAAVGGISAPWLTGMFGITGNMGYLAMIAYGFVGTYILGSLGLKKYQAPFAAGVIAVTAYKFASDKGLLLGYTWNNADYSNIYSMNAARQLTDGSAPLYQQIGSVPIDTQQHTLLGENVLNMESDL